LQGESNREATTTRNENNQKIQKNDFFVHGKLLMGQELQLFIYKKNVHQL